MKEFLNRIVASFSVLAILATQSLFGVVNFVPVASAAGIDDGTCNAWDATITSPASGTAHKGTSVTVSWSFNGTDCNVTDPSVFDIESSHDAGASWVGIAVSALPSSTSVNFDSTAGQTTDDTDYL